MTVPSELGFLWCPLRYTHRLGNTAVTNIVPFYLTAVPQVPKALERYYTAVAMSETKRDKKPTVNR